MGRPSVAAALAVVTAGGVLVEFGALLTVRLVVKPDPAESFTAALDADPLVNGLRAIGLPLIGVGGIATASQAWERIRAGASLVQLYSAMVYEGPGIARRVVRELETLMARDGFASIAEAVGSE